MRPSNASHGVRPRPNDVVGLPTLKSFTEAHPVAVKTGLLAYVTVAYAGMEFACVLRITRQGKLVLTFPDRRSWNGVRYSLVAVVDPVLKAQILRLAGTRYLQLLESRKEAALP